MAIVQFQEVPRNARVMRRPQHTFQIRQRPWQIQPFFIAPVLPGETMKNLLLQARVVTDPIKNPLIGWWAEYFFFYCKHRDLDERDLLTEMVLNPSADLSALNKSANTLHYHAGGIDWVEMCLNRVVLEYFRDEGHGVMDFAYDGLPLAKVTEKNWLDSVINISDYEDPDIDLTDSGSPGGAKVMASEIEDSLRQWQMLRLHNLTDMSYEDYLATYGVRPRPEEAHKPELVRYIRDWSYPSNTVNPADGIPASAVSWTVAERADKDRFFREPGFLFGVCVVRPKVYFAGLAGNASSLLADAYRWLPAVLQGDPYTSLVPVTAGTGPIPGNTEDYVVDVRDLFLYGDQFRNFASADDANLIAIPEADLQKAYISGESDIFGLFVDDENDSERTYVRQDGIVSLSILGRQVDQTPTTLGVIPSP